MFTTYFFRIALPLLLFGAVCGSGDRSRKRAQKQSEVTDICIVYNFADGLQITGFEDQSCQDGESGELLQAIAELQKRWLEEPSLQITAEELEAIGRQQVDQTFRTADRVGGRDYRRVKRIFNELKDYTVRQDLDYSVYLVEYLKKPDVVNAWVTANGTVFITTAMLDFLQSDDELAFILAHELAHVENLLPDFRLASDGKITGLLGRGKIAELLIRAKNTLLTSLNQYDELIADRAALYLMYEAGYDPEAALRIFHTLSKLSPDDQGFNPIAPFVSSHPYHHTRFDCLNSYLYDSRHIFSPCYPEDPEAGAPEEVQ